MSVSSSAKKKNSAVLTAVGESSWLLFCFVVASLVYVSLRSTAPEGFMRASETTIGELFVNAGVYFLVLALVIMPVAIVRHRRYLFELLGVTKKPTLLQLTFLPLWIWLLYMGASMLAQIASQFVMPWVDHMQKQEVGFTDIHTPSELLIVFLALVVLAPIAEELLFRGYLFGRIREKVGFWKTTLVVSLLFGFVHQQWNVGIDTFVLSLFLSYLRESTGSVWASMMLHGLKNFVAYSLLFLAPLFGINLIQ